MTSSPHLTPALGTPPAALAPRAIACSDGSITCNPGGIMAVGFHASIPGVARDIMGGTTYPAAPGNSNNMAEYLAAIEALRIIYRAGHRGPVTLHTDSQLVANQYSGAFGCNVEQLRPLLEKLRTAAGYFEAVEVVWIPRRLNSRADTLARRAYDEAFSSRCGEV